MEFASSVQKAIAPYIQHPLYPELAQRLGRPFVFHVSFRNETPSTYEERSNLWNAVGVRMLYQLLDKPIEDSRRQHITNPITIF